MPVLPSLGKGGGAGKLSARAAFAMRYAKCLSNLVQLSARIGGVVETV